MNNLSYKGIVKLTINNKSYTVHNTGTDSLGKIICDSLLPGKTVDDRYKPCKINLFVDNRPCFSRVVPITGAIYGSVNELPDEIKNIVVSKEFDSDDNEIEITLNDTALGFVRFVSSLIKTSEDNFSRLSSNGIKLSILNSVNEELAYIKDDSYKTLSTMYTELKNEKEVIVDWFMLIVNSQV